MNSFTIKWWITVVSWCLALWNSLFPWCTVLVSQVTWPQKINFLNFWVGWSVYDLILTPGILTSKSLCMCVCVCISTGIYGFHEDTENRLFVLNMPLAHKKSSLVFIMPYHVEPLERLEKLLTLKQLDTWMSKLEEKAVAVSLPKTSMEVSHNLQVKPYYMQKN